MHLTVEHFDGKYPQFNVNLHSKEGAQPFVTIKGARIIDGSKGPFISWPATKNEKTGKYWAHVFGSEGFNNAVMEAAKKGDTRTLSERKQKPDTSLDSVPF
jgi:DNA-binding cell septation regulator SpoVG